MTSIRNFFGRRKASVEGTAPSIHKKLSLVVAAYNMEQYIHEFLESVFNQDSKLKSFEIIVVDDGSEDKTGEIVQEWQKLHPEHIQYIYQSNQGVSAARNTGISIARGEWISFPDADDFLSPNYFSCMYGEAVASDEHDTACIVSNLVMYHEDEDEYRDNHPLSFRFRKRINRTRISNMRNLFQMSASHCWFKSSLVEKYGLTFDSRIKPGFEDAHFVARLLIAEPTSTISFLRNPIYYYRKRSDSSSAIDNGKRHKGWFSDQLEYGTLDILKRSKAEYPFEVPEYIQRMCLYDLFWRFRYLVNNSHRVDFLSAEEIATFKQLITEIMSFIDTETILGFNLAGCSEEHKVALTSSYKNVRKDVVVYCRQLDLEKQEAQFLFHTGGNDDFEIVPLLNGSEVEPSFRSRNSVDFLEEKYYARKFFWVPFSIGDDLSFMVDGEACSIKVNKTLFADNLRWDLAYQSMHIAKKAPKDKEAKRLKKYALSTRAMYRNATVLMDRIEVADDNAEHLYRYLMSIDDCDNTWFVLDRQSSDWERLSSEGFNLLEYGSDEHIAVLVNARLLISSHAHRSVRIPEPLAPFAECLNYKFIFLQHGVVTTDIASGLNRVPLRAMLSTTPGEIAEYLSNDSQYRFSSREVFHTGLPRHDQLVKKASEAQQDIILVAPSWRMNLTSLPEGGGMGRGKNSNYFSSQFHAKWLELLTSDALLASAKKHGLQIVFAPHMNMAMYLEDIDFPDHVRTVDLRTESSYQELIVRAKVAITCFSSVASEVALLQKPVIYFQFDDDEFYDLEHPSKVGYFDFTKDGFGPVVDSPQSAVAKIDAALNGKEDRLFSNRREMAFPFRDQRCCERVYDLVRELRAE